MPSRRISRNALCPCGSGKKFKHCCINKGYDFEEDELGRIRRSIPLSDGLGDELANHLKTLESEYGRPLEDNDLLFPNTQFEHVEHEISQAMQKAGMDPAFIYAFEQTGLLVSEENEDLISDVDRERWEAAVFEYRQKHTIDEEFQNLVDELDYPVGTLARYGPDDKVTTKIVAGVILDGESEPILEKFFGEGVADDPETDQAIQAFFEKHGVKQVIGCDQNVGCPHEEGIDFPVGDQCPLCPFWEGNQGSGAEDDDLPF